MIFLKKKKKNRLSYIIKFRIHKLQNKNIKYIYKFQNTKKKKKKKKKKKNNNK